MYGSPLLLHSQNRPTLILHADAQTLYALSPTDGKPVWEWGMKLEGLIAQPLIIDGSPLRLLLAAYDLNGATMLSLPSQDGVSPQTLWTKPYLKTKFSTPVRWGSMAIGLDNGILQAIDLETGQSLWKKGRFKHGHLLLVDSLLLVLTEDGDLVLVRPDEKGMTELGRVKALEGQTWNPLALSGEYVVVRNSTEAACFRLKTLSP
jgi:outer membrane protein assembly factor BamB